MENTHPKVFIDNNGQPLQTGIRYQWMGTAFIITSFQHGVIHFSNGIQIHYSEFTKSEEETFPINC